MPPDPSNSVRSVPRPLGRASVVGSSPLLTYPEAAALLRVSRSTLTRLVAARRIPHLRIGAQVRFDPIALKAHFAVDQSAPAVVYSCPASSEVPK
jgi:excisionase family DNA binding protein